MSINQTVTFSMPLDMANQIEMYLKQCAREYSRSAFIRDAISAYVESKSTTENKRPKVCAPATKHEAQTSRP
jgi:metal-responsive CopG/Arc/MetJ family transcriptional regulator